MKKPTKVILPEVLTNEMLNHFVPFDTSLFCDTITAELTRRVDEMDIREYVKMELDRLIATAELTRRLNEIDIGEYVKMELDRLVSERISNYINRSNCNTLIGNAVGRLVAENLSINVTKKEDETHA
jgi:hypothetical protein